MPFYSQAYLDAHRAQLERSHLSVGWHPTLRDEFHVSETDRRTGFYISGTTGYGKSGLLRRLIHEDARRGNAVIVLDPNHDLVMDVLAELPESCLSRTYLLNMKDEEYPFGVNVFAVGKLKTSSERTQAVERLVHIFDVLWPDVTKQQNLPLYLRTTAIAMLANQGKTMVDMLNFLTKTPFREAMLQHVTDPMTLDFWEEPGRGDGDMRVTPLVNRLRSLFMGRELVRNIVGQARNSISFRRSIEGREIILIDLPLADLGEDAKLVGTLLLAQIYAAVFSFADTPPEQRPGVSLYVDEMQNFATVDFVKFFTEGRKYGIRTTVAHQYRDQLPDFLQSATKSTGVKLCFRLNADDAKEMAQYFPANEKVIKPEDIDPHVTETFLVRASDYGPMVEMFVDGFLQPLQRYRRGRGKVEIVNGGFDGRAVALGMMSGGQTSGPIQVDDPTYFLDRLFYDVMRTGDWRLPIPWEIPRGLANAGKGFFAAARGAKEWELGPEIMERFPANLVMPTGDGDYRWMRQPESSKETFYFLLFCLRSVMRQLSEEPIGKESVANAAETAKMLTQLPKRAAFIRAGDHGGTIYTHDTPPQVSEYEQERRYQLVQQRTRLKYCHPREDVEQALLNQRSAAPQRPVAPSPALEGEPVLMPYDEV